MKIKTVLIGLATVWMIGGCTCNDCEIRKNEPFLSVEFYSSETNVALSVNFESINGVPPSQIEAIDDGFQSDYRIPLNMHQDSSRFVINSFKTTVPDLFIDTLTLTYSLELFQTEKDFLQFRADSIMLISHTYDSASLICGNPDCTNAEVTLRLFY